MRALEMVGNNTRSRMYTTKNQREVSGYVSGKRKKGKYPYFNG